MFLRLSVAVAITQTAILITLWIDTAWTSMLATQPNSKPLELTGFLFAYEDVTDNRFNQRKAF